MSSPLDDIVIVGAGLRSAAGRDTAAARSALASGRSLVQPAAHGLAELARGAFAQPPLFEVELPRELEAQVKFLNGSGQLCLEAAHEAMVAHEGLRALLTERRSLYLAQMDSYDWAAPDLQPAVVAATESGAKALTDEGLNRAATRKVRPFFLLESLKNNAFAFLSTWMDLRGANTGCAGYGGDTAALLDTALRSLQYGRTDLALFVAAARPTSPIARLELSRHSLPPDGNAPGDGAAALTLVRRETARAHGQPELARIRALELGTAPQGTLGSVNEDALADVVARALASAGVVPAEVALVLAPAGTRAALQRCGVTRAALVDCAAVLGDLSLARFGADLVLAATSLSQGAWPGPQASELTGPVLVLEAGWMQQCGALLLDRATP